MKILYVSPTPEKVNNKWFIDWAIKKDDKIVLREAERDNEEQAKNMILRLQVMQYVSK